MFGKTIERHCPNCNENIKTKVSTGFNIDGKKYYKVSFCPKCKNDLAKEDRTIINKAKDEGKEIRVMKY